MDSEHRVEANRETISSSSSARVRTLGRTTGGYEGGAGRRRRAAGLVTCAPCAAPPTPSACEYWGRRAVHDVSIDYYGVNGAILAPMRRASHAFEFFNIAQFKRDTAPVSSTGDEAGATSRRLAQTDHRLVKGLPRSTRVPRALPPGCGGAAGRSPRRQDHVQGIQTGRKHERAHIWSASDHSGSYRRAWDQIPGP